MWKQPSEKKKELCELYLKMSPEALLIRKIGANIAVDAGELARAEWFWERRPKKLMLSTERALVILIFYAGIWLAAMCLTQQALVETTVLPGIGYTIVGAIPVWAYLDAVRYARWKSDYRRAIFRLLQTVRR
jgi:Na+/melibiose symporter-like transporter